MKPAGRILVRELAIKMTPRTTKWLLFVAMFCTVPVPYFMFVVAGLLPLIAITRLSVIGVWTVRLFDLLHVLVYGVLLYLAAIHMTRWLYLLAPRRRALGVAITLALAALMSLLPIYGVGHSNYEPVNLYELFRRGRLV